MRWTKEKEQKLLDLVILSETGECLNYDELQEYFELTRGGVSSKLTRLRQESALPPIDRAAQIDSYRRPYSNNEIVFIINAINAGMTTTEVAANLERTYHGIAGKINHLIKSGQLQPRSHFWTEYEDESLITLIKFDAHKCVDNYPELTLKLNLSTDQIYRRVCRLRRWGKLPVPTGVSIKAIKAFRLGNAWVFAKTYRGGAQLNEWISLVVRSC